MVNVLDQKSGKNWHAYQGDCIEVVAALPDDSWDLSVYSPPFCALYTYSPSDRDMGNCRSNEDFMRHFSFLLPELLRVTKPGRIMAVHCMDLPTKKAVDGYIGLVDFPGMIVAAAIACGWVWHSKVTIWKDPVMQMQRTKAKGLLHKQIKKDSASSRQGLADYVLIFRKPGENAHPIVHTAAEFPVEQWQKWASPVWMDIDQGDTLQYMRAREEADERHIAPLQLEVIRRIVRLWSNPGDVVGSPFGGIGSEGFVALKEGRRSVSVELKRSYFEMACRNLAAAEPEAKGSTLELFS